MDNGDLVHSIRLWMPERKATLALSDALADKIATAFAEYSESVPQSAQQDIAKLLPHVSAAVGRGFLQGALEKAKELSLADSVTPDFTNSLRALAWGDLLFAAACADRDDAANRRLLELMQKEVLPSLARKWGRERAEEVVDELPQKLHLVDDKGLNRGRARLLTYGGRSRLVTWLKAVANRQAIDCWRSRRRYQPSENLTELAPCATEQDSAERMEHAEDIEIVRRIAPLAFKELMEHLPTVSEQQYRFAYFRCVRQWDGTAIAAELGVGKSRVTELSQQVFRRLIAIMRRLAPELENLSDEPSKERRRWFEEAIGEIFSEASLNDA